MPLTTLKNKVYCVSYSNHIVEVEKAAPSSSSLVSHACLSYTRGNENLHCLTLSRFTHSIDTGDCRVLLGWHYRRYSTCVTVHKHIGSKAVLYNLSN